MPDPQTPLQTTHALDALLLDQERQRRWGPSMPAPTPATSSMPPELLALLGGGLDAASTYKFLKDKSGTEDNPMEQWAGKGPAGTAVGVASMAMGQALMRAALRKKWPKLANAMAANQGAESMALGVQNLNIYREPQGDTSAAEWEAAKQRLITRK